MGVGESILEGCRGQSMGILSLTVAGFGVTAHPVVWIC